MGLINFFFFFVIFLRFVNALVAGAGRGRGEKYGNGGNRLVLDVPKPSTSQIFIFPPLPYSPYLSATKEKNRKETGHICNTRVT